MRAGTARRRALLLVAPALLFLAVFFVYPVVDMLRLAFVDAQGGFTLANFGGFFNQPVYIKVLGVTFRIAALTTLACLVLGYPVAYFLASSSVGLRGKLLLVVLMPFWTGFLVRTFAWMILLADTGPVVRAADDLGISELQLSNNLTGVLVGMTHALLPLAVLNMLAVMQGIDRNLMRVATTLGAHPAEAFWRIYFPLSLPGVAAAGLVVFITALGFFITPAVLGSPRQTMLAQVIIVQLQEVLNWRFAAVLSIVLLASALVVFYAYDRLLGLSTIAGEPRRPHAAAGPARTATAIRVLGALGAAMAFVARLLERAGAWLPARRAAPGDRRPVLALATGLVLAFLVVPSFFVVPVSFTNSAFLDFPPRGFTWKWYVAFFESPIWVSATLRSLYVAAVVAVLAVALGVAAAFALTSRELPGRRWIMGLAVAPMVLPRMTIAVGLFYLLARLGLVGTDAGLVLGHTVLALPFVVVTVLATLQNHDARYARAAATLGASPLRVFVRVTLPLIAGGVAAAAIFAFMTSFDDLNLALFIAGGEQNTLPKQMWSTMILQANPLLGAASTILLVFMTLFALLAEFLARRTRRK